MIDSTGVFYSELSRHKRKIQLSQDKGKFLFFIIRADNHPKAKKKRVPSKPKAGCIMHRKKTATKGKEAAMDLYGGMDLHGDNVFCTLMDRNYKPVFEQRLPNDLPTVLAALAPYRQQINGIAVESTYNWYWLVD